jgi:hypothetical protein
MTDIRTEVQDAIFARLNHASVTDLAALYQHAPNEAQPPLVLIADITCDGEGSKGAGLDRVTFDIITLVREPRRAALHELMAAVRDRLEGAVMTGTAVLISPPEFRNDDDDLLDDGNTYAGTQRFALWAQPA